MNGVELRDRFHTPLRTVAGFQLAHDGDGTVAAAVLLDATSLVEIDRRIARRPAAPEDLSQGAQELSALLAALAGLAAIPDLVLIEAHGRAHPDRLGLAAQFGVAADLPCIGVATAVTFGTARLALHDMRGAFTPLRDGHEQIGWLLRTRPDCAPLVVSPGHRVSMASAPQLAMRFIAEDRRPEPTRLARLLLQSSFLQCPGD